MRDLRLNNTAGFTLIEILVVLMIIAIAAAVATPKITGLGLRREIETQLRALAWSVRLARSQAITLGSPHDIVLDPGENKYWIVNRREPDRVLSERILPKGFRLKKMEYLQEQWRPQIPEEEKSEFWSLSFRPDGTGDDAEIVVEDPEGEDHVIRVYGLLGRAEVEGKK